MATLPKIVTYEEWLELKCPSRKTAARKWLTARFESYLPTKRSTLM
jgi:hypothetical protein